MDIAYRGPVRAALGSAPLPPCGFLGHGLVVTIMGAATDTEPFLGARKYKSACRAVSLT